MPRYLLDTNTLLYAYRGQGECRQRLALARPADLALSSVAVFEIEYGLAKSSNPERLRIFLQGTQRRCTPLDFDDACAAESGRLRTFLEGRGMPIGHYDLLIAGTALAHRLTVVTRDIREFSRVPGLQVENWYD